MNLINILADITAEAALAISVVRTVIIFAMAVLSVLLIITIFMQPANTSGMGAIDNSETYYSKHKKRSTEGVMKMLTVIISISMAVLAIAFFATMIVTTSNGLS